MKALFRIGCVALILGAAYFLPVPRSQAMEAIKKCLQDHQQGPKITTPTHAFLKRQCDGVKKGIAKLPGMKQLCPNSRRWGTQLN